MSQNHCAPIDFEDLGAATLPWSHSYRLASKTIGQDFLIEIAWPPVAPKPDQRFPVIYVLDGNHSFGVTAMAARALQSGPFPLPPTLVVGVGYHFKRPEDHALWGALRLRDFSPCPDPLLESQHPGAAAGCGGADAFLDFLEHEVKPFVASSAPVDASDSTLVGASLGGLFALHTLLTWPHAFQRYVAISPAIYWADRLLLDLEAELAARTANLPARVFLAAGSLEEAHDPRQGFVSNLYALEARLRQRAYPSLEMALRVFEGETHMSVFSGRGDARPRRGVRRIPRHERLVALAEDGVLARRPHSTTALASGSPAKKRRRFSRVRATIFGNAAEVAPPA